MDDDKDLIEFLELLVKLTQENIDFIRKKEYNVTPLLGKYENELKQVRDLINSFDFI